MPALNLPKYGLENLYLFPYYHTREAYQQATGQEPPPFTAARPPKFWFDPKAKDSPKRTVVYDQVVPLDERGVALATPDGKPMLDLLVLNKDEAATVNIPPLGVPYTNVPGAEVPAVPVPLRPLAPGEELMFDFGGVVVVKNTALYPSIEVGFMAADREMLRAIAKKLGV